MVMGQIRQVETWRKLPTDVGSVARHIALSDALSRHAEVATIWWHSTEETALILGAGQKASEIDLAACRAAQVRVVGRNGGGTAVYASSSLVGLDVALPPDHRLIDQDVVESYCWLGETWAAALNALGIPARTVSVTEARNTREGPGPNVHSVAAACFGALSPYEVLSNGKKIVGLSQVRRRGRELLQSGVYTSFSADDIIPLLQSENAAQSAAQLAQVATGLKEEAHRSIGVHELQAAFERALATNAAVRLRHGRWTKEERLYADTHEPDLQ